MEGSGLPIGGLGNHAVITSHNGLTSARLFTDLEMLAVGDIFLLHLLGETLAYQVEQILVVEPEDTSALQPIPGYDYVTLLTCTPYGVNSHRLLVRGLRVEYSDQLLEQVGPSQLSNVTRNTIIAAVLTALVMGLIILLVVKRRSASGRRK